MKATLSGTPMALDRLATSAEIRAALLTFADPVDECPSEIVREIAADVGGYVRIAAAEFEIVRLVEELLEQQDGRAD